MDVTDGTGSGEPCEAGYDEFDLVDPWPDCDDVVGAVPVSEAREPDPAVVVGDACTPPPLLDLDAIPDQPSLEDACDEEVVAVFEVSGHDLVGKYVVDREAAEGGLRLWQELVLRMPENQLRDLVQFEISTDTDPVAYFNRTGDTTASRAGLKIGFSTESFATQQEDVCAPLVPRRGTFDWSLVHELGHLRGWLDGSWPRFLEAFPDVRGDGEGYPEDGSPVLTGDFVTSYAERADGDEDHAESFTTWVMLGELPPAAEAGEEEPLALQKVRWMATQPGLVELRQAMRITEPDGGNATVDGAPRLPPSVEPIAPPAFLHGTWRAQRSDDALERQFVISADNLVEGVVEADGSVTPVRDLQEAVACGLLARFEVNFREATGWGYNATLGRVRDYPLEDSFFYDAGPDVLYWTRLGGQSDVTLVRVAD